MTIEITEQDFYNMRNQRDNTRTELVSLSMNNANQQEKINRQALMIYAKDRQISELTRMLFALGKQDGQTIRTQDAEIERLTAELESYKNRVREMDKETHGEL